MSGTRMAKPFYVKMTDAEWAQLDDDGRAIADRNFRPGGSKVKPNPSQRPKTATQTVPSVESNPVSALVADAEQEQEPLLDLREWKGDFDGIPEARLRNCIIFMLDYKKDNQWYRDNLTEGYLRRRLAKFGGITGARKIHEDTPPGWAPPEKDPMIKIRSFVFDGETMQVKEIVRAPRTKQEWDLLQSTLCDSYGRRNGNIVPWLADKNCPKCKGKGIYLVRHGNEKGRNFKADTWADCTCVVREWSPSA